MTPSLASYRAIPNRLLPLLSFGLQSKRHKVQNRRKRKSSTYKRHHRKYELCHSLQTACAHHFVVVDFSPNGEIAEPQQFNVFVIMVISLNVSANFNWPSVTANKAF